jgi:HEAT repeat protein
MRNALIIVMLVSAFALRAVPLFADETGDAVAVLKADASSDDERAAACASLGEIGGTKAQKALLDFLQANKQTGPMDEVVSIALADSLAAIGGAPVEKTLVALLSESTDFDKDNWVLVGSRALGAMKSAKAVKPLVAALRLDVWSDGIYESIAHALEQIGDRTAAAGIASALKPVAGSRHFISARERAALLHALGNLGTTASVKAVLPSLRDPSASVRETALAALTDLGWAAKTDDEKMWGALAEKDWDALAVAGMRAVPALIVALNDDRTAETARKMLVSLGAPAIAPLIAATAGLAESGPSDPTPVFAAALAAFGPPAFDPLIAALKNTDRSTRSTVMEALGLLKDGRAAPAIAKLMAKELNKDVTMEAGAALGQLGEAGAEPLYALLSGRDEQARYWAAFAFNAGTSASEQRVIDIGHASKDRDVRGACAWVLEGIGSDTARAVSAELLGSDPAKVTEKDLDSTRTWLMLAVLQRSTDSSVADTFLNSSNTKLQAAAELWATWHGYRILRY